MYKLQSCEMWLYFSQSTQLELEDMFLKGIS